MNTVLAIDDATCAAEKMTCHCTGPPTARSGTTTVSPGCKVAFSDSPLHMLFFMPSTEPSALTTNTLFLSPRRVGPPACLRYQFALLPGRKETAVALKTCP